MAIAVPEAREPRHSFRLGVDRFPPAISVVTPMRNETPPRPVEGSLACLRVLPDHPVLLAGSRVVVRCNVCLLDKIGDAEPELVR